MLRVLLRAHWSDDSTDTEIQKKVWYGSQQSIYRHASFEPRPSPGDTTMKSQDSRKCSPTNATTPDSLRAAEGSTLPSLARARVDSTGAAKSSRVLIPTSATYTASPLVCIIQISYHAMHYVHKLSNMLLCCLHEANQNMCYLTTGLHQQQICLRHSFQISSHMSNQLLSCKQQH